MKITINELRQLVKKIILENVEQFDVEQMKIKDFSKKVFPEYDRNFEKERMRVVRLLANKDFDGAKKYIINRMRQPDYSEIMNEIAIAIAKDFASFLPNKKQFTEMVKKDYPFKYSDEQYKDIFMEYLSKLKSKFLANNFRSDLINDILDNGYPKASTIINSVTRRKHGFDIIKK